MCLSRLMEALKNRYLNMIRTAIRRKCGSKCLRKKVSALTAKAWTLEPCSIVSNMHLKVNSGAEWMFSSFNMDLQTETQIQNADTNLVVKDCDIIRQGNHEELIQMGDSIIPCITPSANETVIIS